MLNGLCLVSVELMANEFLAAEIARRPNRYCGFAHLAMQNPVAAAAELQRTVEEFGFVGAMGNGHTNGVYFDDSTSKRRRLQGRNLLSPNCFEQF